jgi:hypothetical protein
LLGGGGGMMFFKHNSYPYGTVFTYGTLVLPVLPVLHNLY